jgi:hypothetical protein
MGIFTLLPVEEDRGSYLFSDTAEVFNFAAAAPLWRPNIVQVSFRRRCKGGFDHGVGH